MTLQTGKQYLKARVNLKRTSVHRTSNLKANIGKLKCMCLKAKVKFGSALASVHDTSNLKANIQSKGSM
jgi:hypothetical protein